MPFVLFGKGNPVIHLFFHCENHCFFETNHRYFSKFHWFAIKSISRRKLSQSGIIFTLGWFQIRILRNFLGGAAYSEMSSRSCRLSNLAPAVPWSKRTPRFTPWCASRRPSDFIYQKAENYLSFLNFLVPYGGVFSIINVLRKSVCHLKRLQSKIPSILLQRKHNKGQ